MSANLRKIYLTQKDVTDLLMALGYATGAYKMQTGESAFSELTDRVLVQLDSTNYTYFKSKEEVIESLRKDGIEPGNPHKNDPGRLAMGETA